MATNNQTNPYLQALKQTIGFVQEPPTIDEAIDSEYYLKPVLPPMVYPFWREKLRELFPDNITTKSTYVLLHGCIGGGKSTMAQIIILYDIIKMTCMRSIEEFAGIGALQGIYIKCSNTYKNKSQDFVDTINFAVFGGKSPFFQREYERGNKFLHNLKIQATGSKPKEIVSNDVSTFWLSEINELPADKALALVSSADSRLTSRFINCENVCTHLIVDSSTKGTNAATEALLREDPKFSSSNSFRIHVNSWNALEGLGRYFNYGSFEVYSGDAQNNPFVVPKGFTESERLRYDKDRFITCPMELYPEAVRNITLFLQEKCGIASNSSSKFFTDHTSLDKAFCLDMSSDEVIRVDFFDKFDTVMEKVKHDIAKLPVDRKVYVKIDMGIASDLCGVAVAYSDGLDRTIVDGINTDRLIIDIPLCFGISRYSGQETPINKVEDFILQLNQVRTVAMVLSDQFQSSELRQIMIQNGIPAKLQSVDRNDSAYVIAKNYIYSGLVHLPKNDRLKVEAEEIERVDVNKIDHPFGGCFTGESEVLVYDKVSEEITTVNFNTLLTSHENYQVFTFNGLNFSLSDIKKVWETKKTDTLVKLEFNDQVYFCTPEHKILTANGWKEAQCLTIFDVLVSKSNVHKISYQSIYSVPKISVFDLETVSENHNFCLSNGVVVHNSKDLLDCCVGLIAHMVEEGPEKVLEPPESQLATDMVDIYNQLSNYRQNKAITHSGVSSYSDYFSGI